MISGSKRPGLALFLAATLLQLLAFSPVLADEGSGSESILTSEIGRANNESLFWGPYKSNLYFGVRPRTPQGLWAGLMWAKVDSFQDVQSGNYLHIPTHYYLNL